jgi:hypothetical protein
MAAEVDARERNDQSGSRPHYCHAELVGVAGDLAQRTEVQRSRSAKRHLGGIATREAVVLCADKMKGAVAIDRQLEQLDAEECEAERCQRARQLREPCAAPPGDHQREENQGGADVRHDGADGPGARLQRGPALQTVYEQFRVRVVPFEVIAQDRSHDERQRDDDAERRKRDGVTGSRVRRTTSIHRNSR